MASAKKRSLPLLAPLPIASKGAEGRRANYDARPPSIDVARRNLGRRASTNGEAGRIVVLAGKNGISVIGIVLFGSAIEIDVWLDDGIVRRTQPSQAEPFFGVVPDELTKLAVDARVFGLLREGQRVFYETREARVMPGAIVEKCRYGALVLSEDGKVLAVGFRKLWPLVAPDSSPN
jgi:hypothetical protein